MNRIIRLLIYNLLFLGITLTIGITSAFAKVASASSQSIASPFSAYDFHTTLYPNKIHSQTSIEIAKKLREKHFLKLPVDDELSQKMFDRYLMDLDPRHNYFLAQDIRQFEIYRYRLDNALIEGNLGPGFRIFNKYHLRAVQRLVYIVNRIQSGLHTMDFTINENIETDRENAPWPRGIEEQHEIWRKQLKNQVLSLKLSGKSIDDIAELLEKRYLSQLNRYSQFNEEDAFGFFMNSFTRTYDPHTQYLSPKLSEEFDLEMSLSLEGIGAVLQTENEHTKVLRIIIGGPADKSKKLMPGDRIVGVGQGMRGEIAGVVGQRLDKIVRMIRGPKNTVVRLQIIPVDEHDEHRTKVVSIIRNTVKLEEQAAQKKVFEIKREAKSYKIGVIDVPAFYRDFEALHAGREDYRSTTRDVERLLKELGNEDIHGIIIDLRENSGGSLQEAGGLAGLFIKSGPIVQIQQVGGKIFVVNDDDPGVAYNGPLVVLINRLSASASEIFAGAIQDYGQGILTGSSSFGKGTVQSMVKVRHGQLKITTAKFYRISGKSTQNKGVSPDINFPETYDRDTIGENSLTGALAWDTIMPAFRGADFRISRFIGTLNALHEKRISDSPDFAYLTDSIKILKKIEGKTSYSLCETIREQERKEFEAQRLLRENKLRIAKGLDPLKNVDEIKKYADIKTDGKDTEELDPLLKESGHILVDLISLK
jgi:carboxyl-terminal processing protease